MTADEGASLTSEHGEPGDGAHKRDSLWQSAAATSKFLREIIADKTLVVRDEDKLSSKVLSILLFVGLSFICVGAYLQDWDWLRTRLGAGGFTPFRPFNLVVLGAVDVLYLIPLCWFVLYRLGILRTIPKRHALICCQLMIGASILTALICVNIAIFVLLICLGNNMHTLVG
jgi:hypothetical protein